VRHENTDADHAKQCGNDLDHHDGPLCFARTKRHRRPNSQKKSAGCKRIAMQLMISGNRACQKDGEPPARLAFWWQHSEDFGDISTISHPRRNGRRG
jgi:hypothetical protein